MIPPIAAALLSIAPTQTAAADAEIFVCGRTMRFEDQYCDAVMEGRRWGHAEAAQAHERQAPYALPGGAAAAYLAAANNWIAAGQPGKAVVAFDRALAAGLTGDERRNVLAARARAQATIEQASPQQGHALARCRPKSC